MAGQPIPDIYITDSQPEPSSNLPIRVNQEHQSQTVPRYIPDESLELQLWRYQVNHANGRDKFWPTTVLRGILTERRIRDELKRLGYSKEKAKDYSARLLCTGDDAVFQVLALLVLLEQLRNVEHILDCDSGIRDKHLPLMLDWGKQPRITYKDGALPKLCCAETWNSWKHSSLASLNSYQYQVMIPTFRLGENNTIEHQELDSWRILPWCDDDTVEPVAAMSGGFGSVSRVRIHRDCHDFHRVLKSINVAGGFFAIKKLKNKDQQKYRQEVQALERFNGKVHKHLVTLLATFRHNGHYHMIFPWAHCDLDQYWQNENPNPNLNDVDFLRWVSKQCAGLMEAVNVIHNPSHLATDKRYGRHGDIKAENILWYRTGGPGTDDKGIFVISDLGLAAINTQKSRSMQPNTQLSTTPSYRPPECDIEGGVISRAFDIWTMGCMYLELLCWLLTGYKGKHRFDNERTTLFIHGSKADIYFDVERRASRSEDGAEFVFKVKDVVSRKISELHGNKNCTPWAHDLLDIVEKEMLVVLTKGNPRSTSGVLLEKLRNMNIRCQEDERYCSNKVPNGTRLRNWRPSNGVLAKLNEVARTHVGPEPAFLNVNNQDTNDLHKSLQPQELGRMDVRDSYW